jgi:branched-chain amino acid transport system permease protein
MQAVRDRDVAAEVVGVNLARYKVSAFALSSAYAGICGALFGSYFGYVHPDQWSLNLSIQFIAIIIVGGVGTIFGAVLGALFIAGLPPVIDEYANSIPLVSWLTKQGHMSTDTFNQLLFGLVIIVFLVSEPLGLAGIWFRIKNYFRAWPFTY